MADITGTEWADATTRALAYIEQAIGQKLSADDDLPLKGLERIALAAEIEGDTGGGISDGELFRWFTVSDVARTVARMPKGIEA